MTRTPFRDVIQTEAELRAIIGYPGQIPVDKALNELDTICTAFIAASPFCLIASADAAGKVDVSPKGDPAGFVQVPDSHTLLIPDRPGNRRGDTLSNILQNPQVGILFMVPGSRETLRVSGTAQIVRDDDQRATFAVNGKIPALLIAVAVEEVFFHCTRCMVRSGLWSADARSATAPTMAEAMISHAKLALSLAEAQAMVEEDEREGLY